MRILKRNLTLTILQSVLLMLLASFIVMWFVLLFPPDNIDSVFISIKSSNYLPLILNLLPILMLMALLFSLSNNTIISIGSVSLAVIIMTIVHRLKMVYRVDPFVPWDILLGTEVLEISKSFGTKAQFVVVGGIISAIIAIVVCNIVIKNQKLPNKYRFSLFVVTLLSIFIVNEYVYSNQKIDQNLFIEGNIYNQVNIFNSKGFLYSFIYNFNTTKIEKPENYDKTEIQNLISSHEVRLSDNLRTPHIIMIMGEAFSDIPLHEKFDFTGYEDPLKNYVQINQDSVFTGQLVTPNIGGGTADTEFDVLTGLNSRNFRGVPYSYMLIGKEYNALPSVLSKLGYHNVAIHPGHSWFYNRINVFKYLGFDKFYNIQHFDENDTKGMYITEVATFDKVIGDFESFKAENPNKPYFSFTITIQNHGPYPSKYLSETNFETSIALSDDDINGLSNYFEGVYDADIQLARLVEYLESINEPVVLVYFGDHLPALGRNVYEEFVMSLSENTLDEKTVMYRTPFIIWQNSASENENILNTNISIPEIMSSNYFGATLLEMLGFSNLDSYFDFVVDMRNNYPVILENEFFDEDFQLFRSNEEHFPDFDLFHKFQYYKIFE